jgi:hypothetical protein
MRRLYLAGPIHGCSDTEARDWRERVKRDLAGLYEFADPMDRDYRGNEASVSPNEIVDPDIDDLWSCSHAIFNCDRPSWGTSQELVYARSRGVRSIAFGAGVSSPWVRYHASRWCGSLSDAITALRLEAA